MENVYYTKELIEVLKERLKGSIPDPTSYSFLIGNLLHKGFRFEDGMIKFPENYGK